MMCFISPFFCPSAHFWWRHFCCGTGFGCRYVVHSVCDWLSFSQNDSMTQHRGQPIGQTSGVLAVRFSSKQTRVQIPLPIADALLRLSPVGIYGSDFAGELTSVRVVSYTKSIWFRPHQNYTSSVSNDQPDFGWSVCIFYFSSFQAQAMLPSHRGFPHRFLVPTENEHDVKEKQNAM